MGGEAGNYIGFSIPPVPSSFAIATRPIVRGLIRAYLHFVLRKAAMFAPLLQIILNACDAQPEPADSFAGQRQRMVDEQIAARGRDVKDPRVLHALATVPRHEFIPPESRALAYSDRPLPIGFDQTISQPYIVAFMTEQLHPQPAHRVLEIGTGSGYQAAVLSMLVADVYTIEIVEPLAKRAAADLERLGYRNVHVRAGDGYRGWPDAAPFDAIIVTCAPNHVPQPLVEQLKEGGRIVIPVGEFGAQRLFVLEKMKGGLEERAVLPVSFVPMTGDAERRR